MGRRLSAKALRCAIGMSTAVGGVMLLIGHAKGSPVWLLAAGVVLVSAFFAALEGGVE